MQLYEFIANRPLTATEQTAAADDLAHYIETQGTQTAIQTTQDIDTLILQVTTADEVTQTVVYEVLGGAIYCSIQQADHAATQQLISLYDANSIVAADCSQERVVRSSSFSDMAESSEWIASLLQLEPIPNQEVSAFRTQLPQLIQTAPPELTRQAAFASTRYEIAKAVWNSLEASERQQVVNALMESSASTAERVRTFETVMVEIYAARSTDSQLAAAQNRIMGKSKRLKKRFLDFCSCFDL